MFRLKSDEQRHTAVPAPLLRQQAWSFNIAFAAPRQRQICTAGQGRTTACKGATHGDKFVQAEGIAALLSREWVLRRGAAAGSDGRALQLWHYECIGSLCGSQSIETDELVVSYSTQMLLSAHYYRNQ